MFRSMCNSRRAAQEDRVHQLAHRQPLSRPVRSRGASICHSASSDRCVAQFVPIQQNRTARELFFQIDTQQVELNPAAGEDIGRMDISFRPLVAREDIYFCLECKRLNVIFDGRTRSYASEYVVFGVARFVSGQYASRVRHGGMLAYVLNGDAARAIVSVESNLRERHAVLGMEPPGAFAPSSIIVGDAKVKETHHRRGHDAVLFCLHHMFMARVHAPMDSVASLKSTVNP